MTRQQRTRGRRGRGFTLIELLIATTLLAVLALLAWRGLDSVLASRQRIVAASDELRSLTLAFAQLDEDLRKSWPVRLLRLQAPSISFTVSGEQGAVALEMLREASGASEPTQIQRVSWRVRQGVLERGFGQWSIPAAAGGASATPQGSTAMTSAAQSVDGLIWQPILGKVASLQMQGWVSGQGWIAAEALAGQLRGPGADAAAGSGAQAPPAGDGQAGGSAGTGGSGSPPAAAGKAETAMVTGLLVRIVRQDGEVLLRVFPVKD